MSKSILATTGLAFLAACVLAACGRIEGEAPVPRTFGDASEGQLAWVGVRACADCERIEANLTLQWSGEERQYRMIETYVDANGPTRFEDAGRWSNRGDLILLEGEKGERHAFRLLDDGRLQPRNLDGNAFEGSRDFLQPMEAGDAY